MFRVINVFQVLRSECVFCRALILDAGLMFYAWEIIITKRREEGKEMDTGEGRERVTEGGREGKRC